MSQPDLDPLDAMREQFRAAAARDIEASAPRHSRARRWFSRRSLAGRWIVVGLAAAAGTAGLATAGGLISVGEPKPEIEGKAPKYAPSGKPQIVVVAPLEAGRELPFGAAVYTAKNGDDCVLAGEVRGDQIGAVEGDVFRPLADDFAGACRDLTKGPIVQSNAVIDNHLLLFGRVSDEIKSVSVDTGHEQKTAPVGVGGAFLIVFDDAAHVSLATMNITLLDANGKPVLQ